MKPISKRLQVAVGDAKAFSNFAGRQPIVVIGRCGILLFGEKLVEGRLLIRGPGQNERQLVELLIRRHSTDRVLRRGPLRNVVGQGAELACLLCILRAGQGGAGKKQS